MKKLFVSCLLATALLACGGKNKTAPSNTTTPKVESKDGNATGGTTYGAKTPATPTTPSGTADPCAAP